MRTTMLAVLPFARATCIALCGLGVLASVAAAGGPSSRGVIVPDFLHGGSVDMPDAGQSAARWMRETLASQGELYRVVPEHEWLPDTIARNIALGPSLSPSAAGALHRLSGADLVAQGDISHWGNTYALEVRVFALPEGRWLHTEREWVHAPDEVPDAVARLTERLFGPQPRGGGVNEESSAEAQPIRPVPSADEPGEAAETLPDAAAPRATAPEEMAALLERRFPEMAFVPGGAFLLGTDETNVPVVPAVDSGRRLPPAVEQELLATERPAHQVTLRPFLIDRCEVTNAQFQAFRPDHTFPPGMEDMPVTNVSWNDAVAFAGAQGKRLPTEAEWERAARGDEGRRWPWGNRFVREAVAFGFGPVPVNSYPAGASAYGVLHFADNVQEWTASLFAPYPGNRTPNVAYDRGYRVVRGSHWNGNSFLARTTARFCANPGVPGERPDEPGYDVIGFRCARDVPPSAVIEAWREEGEAER